MSFNAPRSRQEYPPSAFCSKYEKFLAPHGLLLPPKQVLKNRKLGEGAEDALRRAFKITLTKLKKRRTSCAECGRVPERPLVCGACAVACYCDDTCRQPRLISHAMVCALLKQELYDQVLECLPSPLSLGKEIIQGKGGFVKSWKDWFDNHTSLGCSIKSASTIVTQWWSYTGLKYPGDAAVHAALERMISNVFSTVLTISHSVLWLQDASLFTNPEVQENVKISSLLKKKNVNIHLIGADIPEVSAVESGLVQVMSRVLQGTCVHLTLIAPDLVNHPRTMSWTVETPLRVSHQVSVACYAGLYHNFWAEHYDEKSNDQAGCVKPDVAVAIHPGCHTKEMWLLWQPTLKLLAAQKIPVVMTTYNRAEHLQTIKALGTMNASLSFEGVNPLASLQTKQTPYEPDHVWAANAYALGISNK